MFNFPAIIMILCIFFISLTASADTNKMIHIHRGILGDTNTSGGVSDLDSRVHRWLNPVARITVTVEN